MFPRAVTDNIQELLKEQGRVGDLIPATSKQELDQFLGLLKKKLLADIDRLTGDDDARKRAVALADIQEDLNVYAVMLSSELTSSTLLDIVFSRLEKMGGYAKRYILRGVRKDDSQEADRVLSFGEKHEYPGLTLKRNEHGEPFLALLPGKEAWEKAVKNRNLHTQFMDTFKLIADAVDRDDIIGGK